MDDLIRVASLVAITVLSIQMGLFFNWALLSLMLRAMSRVSRCAGRPSPLRLPRIGLRLICRSIYWFFEHPDYEVYQTPARLHAPIDANSLCLPYFASCEGGQSNSGTLKY